MAYEESPNVNEPSHDPTNPAICPVALYPFLRPVAEHIICISTAHTRHVAGHIEHRDCDTIFLRKIRQRAMVCPAALERHVAQSEGLGDLRSVQVRPMEHDGPHGQRRVLEGRPR